MRRVHSSQRGRVCTLTAAWATWPLRELHSIERREKSSFSTFSVTRLSRVRVEEGAEVVCQGLRLVDRDEGVAVVDPHQLGVLEVLG